MGATVRAGDQAGGSEELPGSSPRLREELADDEPLKRIPAAAAYFYEADGAPMPVGTIAA